MADPTTPNNVTANATSEEHETSLAMLTLALIPAMTIFGNVLVVLAVYRERTLQSVTNYFVCSLAVADFFVALLVMPFAVYIEFHDSKWYLGDFMCNMYIMCDVCASTASILNLFAISLDRFVAITRPIYYSRQSRSLKRGVVTIGCVWCVSLAIAVPIHVFNRLPPNKNLCMFANPTYIIGSSLCSFWVPCIVMTVLYTIILKKLRSRELQKKKQKQRKDRPLNAMVANLIGHARMARDVGKLLGERAEHDLQIRRQRESMQQISHQIVVNLSPASQSKTTSSDSSTFDSEEDSADESTRHQLHATPVSSEVHNCTNRLPNVYPDNTPADAHLLPKDHRNGSKKKLHARKTKSSSTPPRKIAHDESNTSLSAECYPVKHLVNECSHLSAPTDPMAVTVEDDDPTNPPFEPDAFSETAIAETTLVTMEVQTARQLLQTASSPFPLTSELACSRFEFLPTKLRTNWQRFSSDIVLATIEEFMPRPIRSTRSFGEDMTFDSIPFIDSNNGAGSRQPSIRIKSAPTLALSTLEDFSCTPFGSFRLPHTRIGADGVVVIESSVDQSRSVTIKGAATMVQQNGPTTSTTTQRAKMLHNKQNNHVLLKSTKSVGTVIKNKHAHDCPPSVCVTSASGTKLSSSISVPHGGMCAVNKIHQHSDSQVDEQDSSGSVVQQGNSLLEGHSQSIGSTPLGSTQMRKLRTRLSSNLSEARHSVWKHVKANVHFTTVKNIIPTKRARRKEHRQIRKERKATHTLAIVLAVFLVCWIPFFVCHTTEAICLAFYHDDGCIDVRAFTVGTWLGYMNSFMNPVIYTIFNPEYRRAFRRIFTCK